MKNYLQEGDHLGLKLEVIQLPSTEYQASFNQLPHLMAGYGCAPELAIERLLKQWVVYSNKIKEEG